jgi:adenosylcobinamide-GDP ribazoletransferase
MHSFLVALAFLTVVPLRFRELPPPAAVARSRFWYPVVGLLLGALLGGWTALLLAWGRSQAVSAFLVLLAWVLVTGALHLDGFCDLCDGLFGGGTPEDRLRILKDPRRGTFGVVGGVLLLLGKFVALEAVLTEQPARAPWLVAAAAAVARCLVLCVAAGAHYPRPEGTGRG